MLWTGSYDSAIADDVFIDLTEMVENYMPAYKECYDQLPDDTKRQLHTDEGNFPRLYSINNYPAGATEGAFVRTDYLEKVGMDIPTTYDELDAVLRAFQTELNLPEPLMATSGIVHTSNALCSGYGVSGSFSTFPMFADPYYVVDGQVKFGVIEDGYKEYMEMFSTYYATESSARTLSPRTRTPWSSAAPFPPATWACSSARPTWSPTILTWARPQTPTLPLRLCLPSPRPRVRLLILPRKSPPSPAV